MITVRPLMVNLNLELTLVDFAELLGIDIGKPFKAHFGDFDDYWEGHITLLPTGKFMTTKVAHGGELEFGWEVSSSHLEDIILQLLKS